MQNSTAQTRLTQRWQRIALSMDIGLLLLVMAWQLLPTPTIEGMVKAAVLSLPLLLPLHGLRSGKRHTYRWATLCVLPYFLVGMTEAVANPSARLFAAAMLALALLWFIALVAFLRVTAPPPATP